MGYTDLNRKMNRIDSHLSKIEKSIKSQLEDIDGKLKSYEQVDSFDQIIELIMLFCVSFKLIILGSAILIPWRFIRDFWVKISMCVFMVKSSKRLRKAWKKNQSQKEIEDEVMMTEAEKGKNEKVLLPA